MVIFTIHLHIIMGVLFAAMALAFLHSYNKSRNKEIIIYFVLWTFLSLYSLFLGLPLLISAGDLHIAAWGFIIGMTFLFLAELAGFYTLTFKASDFIDAHNKKIGIIFSLLSLICIEILIFDFRLPIIDDSGLVIWNANPIAGAGFGMLALYIGSSWLYFSYKHLRFVDDKLAKVKTMVLGMDGMMWAIAAVLYFNAGSALPTILAFVIMIVSLIFSAGLIWLLKY